MRPGTSLPGQDGMGCREQMKKAVTWTCPGGCRSIQCQSSDSCVALHDWDALGELSSFDAAPLYPFNIYTYAKGGYARAKEAKAKCWVLTECWLETLSFHGFQQT